MTAKERTARRRAPWRLPLLVGLGVWVSAVLAVAINLATNLVPGKWEEWPPYPWIIWGSTILFALLAAGIAALVQRHSGGRDSVDASSPPPVSASGERAVAADTNTGIISTGDNATFHK